MLLGKYVTGKICQLSYYLTFFDFCKIKNTPTIARTTPSICIQLYFSSKMNTATNIIEMIENERNSIVLTRGVLCFLSNSYIKREDITVNDAIIDIQIT